MVQAIRSLDELIGKGCDVAIGCRGCGHQAFEAPVTLVTVFRARGWQTGWREAPQRFRCARCRSKDVALTLRFREETVRAGLRPPPPGVAISVWNRASEAERKRLVDRSRS